MSGVMAVMAGLTVLSEPNLVIYDFSSGSGTVTVPVGATDLVIETWGGGGGGGRGDEAVGEGGGGGAGGYSKKTLALSGDDGKTIMYAVGVGGQGSNTADPGNIGGFTTVSSGTYILTTLASLGGGGGLSDGTATQGAGGTSTGGDTNTTGAGSAPFSLAGAAATAGDGGLLGGAGGDGAFPVLGGARGDRGSAGRARFVFTI